MTSEKELHQAAQVYASNTYRKDFSRNQAFAISDFLAGAAWQEERILKLLEGQWIYSDVEAPKNVADFVRERFK